jgi:hypothetical protein
MWFKHIVSIVSLPESILVIFPASLIALFGLKLLWGYYFRARNVFHFAINVANRALHLF